MGKLEKESYAGKKYHFRYYRKSVYHLFLVAIIIESTDNNGKVLISGFNMTRSIEMVLSSPSKFVRITNPNPNDDALCFVCIDPIKEKPLKHFTRPIRDWELSDEDEKTIYSLVKQKLL